MPSGVSAPIRARTPALRHPGATKAHPISLQPPPRASQVIHFFKAGDDEASAHSALSASLSAASITLESVKQEYCFNVQLADGQKPLSADEESRLLWLLAETFEPERTARTSFLRPASGGSGGALLELGPRLSFCTAWSSNAVSICHA